MSRLTPMECGCARCASHVDLESRLAPMQVAPNFTTGAMWEVDEEAVAIREAHRQREEMRKAGWLIEIEHSRTEEVDLFCVSGWLGPRESADLGVFIEDFAPTENEATQACYDKWKAGEGVWDE